MTIHVIFFGTPEFAVPGLNALIATKGVTVRCVVTQPDKPVGRGGTIQASPVKQVAETHGIPVLQPRSIRKELPAFLEKLSALGAIDIGVVIAFGQILPLEVLTLPKAGCVNVHASLLPRWRGAAPIHRAILAGDSETGVCLMDMEVGLDTGGVFATGKTTIESSDNVGTLHDRLAELGASLLKENITKIVTKEIPLVPQPSEGVTYASKITPEEARIDWQRSSEEIDRQVRAFSPYPGAYTIWQNKRLKILQGECVSSANTSHPSAVPGEVISAHSGRLEIVTGQGTFRVTSLQLEGKRRVSVSEFLNGNVIAVGATFGK
jgi:methionyl-tRNA formyltransferase